MEKVLISLQVKSQRRRQSLTALLTTIPGVQVLSARSLLTPMDILLVEGSLSNAEHIAALRRVRLSQPGLKTILLVETTRLDTDTHLEGIDLILPLNATAGELFHSIGLLADR